MTSDWNRSPNDIRHSRLNGGAPVSIQDVIGHAGSADVASINALSNNSMSYSFSPWLLNPHFIRPFGIAFSSLYGFLTVISLWNSENWAHIVKQRTKCSWRLNLSSLLWKGWEVYQGLCALLEVSWQMALKISLEELSLRRIGWILQKVL